MVRKNILEIALAFATGAHCAINQRRKYTGERYIIHPIDVQNIVKDFGGSIEQRAAAYLHDVVEDTEVDFNILNSLFGPHITEIVRGVTNISKPEDGNRAARKAKDAQHISNSSDESQFIKCADIIHNTSDIFKFDKKFASLYLEEQTMVLDLMSPKTKDTEIWKEAKQQCNDLLEKF